MKTLGIIAGNGYFPLLTARSAREQGVSNVVCCAFHGETDKAIERFSNDIIWLKVGALTRMIKFFKKHGVDEVIMAGQITPKKALDLPVTDLRLLKLMTRLDHWSAEPIFKEVAHELEKEGLALADSTKYIKEYLAREGVMAGGKLSKQQKEDAAFGFRLAKELARLDIGQTIVVKKKAVIAVEGIDGTDATLIRSAGLTKEAVAVKVSKPGQDMRFDVPVIGPATIEACQKGSLRVLALETGKTLLLNKEETLCKAVSMKGFTLIGISEQSTAGD